MPTARREEEKVDHTKTGEGEDGLGAEVGRPQDFLVSSQKRLPGIMRAIGVSEIPTESWEQMVHRMTQSQQSQQSQCVRYCSESGPTFAGQLHDGSGLNRGFVQVAHLVGIACLLALLKRNNPRVHFDVDLNTVGAPEQR